MTDMLTPDPHPEGVSYRKLPVYPGGGRQIVHDSRSFKYPASTTSPQSVLHRLDAIPVDQGYIGSCTGSSAINLLNTRLFAGERKAVLGRPGYLTQEDALGIYSRATEIDPFDGSWPPEDTGSSGLAVAQVLRERGFIREYRHAFGLDHLLSTLPLQPVMVGTTWYANMTFPENRGGNYYAVPSGDALGGHEYLCIGANLRSKYLTFVNSWGPHWPTWNHKGRFRISFDHFDFLLQDYGDVTVPVNWA